ncbi:MAG: amidohydrolase, partial [Alphaproteobacteria bacterium]
MGHTPPDDAWLDSLQEEILEPDLEIVDPHHHLWMRGGYRYLIPELAADLASGHNVVSTVYAECHSMYRPDG